MVKDNTSASSRILFVGCLFKSQKKNEKFASYAATCQKTITSLQQLFPNCAFQLHVDDSVDPSIRNNFAKVAKVVLHNYPTAQEEYSFAMNSSVSMRRQNCDQLTKCMRLTTLFSKTWSDDFDYCIVLDIHDDINVTAKLIRQYLASMTPQQQYLLTTWKSTEQDCPYDPYITRKTHAHFDAGLVICKRPLPSRTDFSFAQK
jgi:hypothetical protein